VYFHAVYRHLPERSLGGKAQEAGGAKRQKGIDLEANMTAHEQVVGRNHLYRRLPFYIGGKNSLVSNLVGILATARVTGAVQGARGRVGDRPYREAFRKLIRLLPSVSKATSRLQLGAVSRLHGHLVADRSPGAAV
jgi:hypothetical protein